MRTSRNWFARRPLGREDGAGEVSGESVMEAIK
jgi:hypothetical protein